MAQPSLISSTPLKLDSVRIVAIPEGLSALQSDVVIGNAEFKVKKYPYAGHVDGELYYAQAARDQQDVLLSGHGQNAPYEHFTNDKWAVVARDSAAAADRPGEHVFEEMHSGSQVGAGAAPSASVAKAQKGRCSKRGPGSSSAQRSRQRKTAPQIPTPRGKIKSAKAIDFCKLLHDRMSGGDPEFKIVEAADGERYISIYDNQGGQELLKEGGVEEYVEIFEKNFQAKFRDGLLNGIPSMMKNVVDTASADFFEDDMEHANIQGPVASSAADEEE